MYRCLVYLAALPLSFGQATPQIRFEVASVKRAANDEFSTRPERSPGRFRWTTQLGYLIGYAHHLDFSQVSGSHLGAIYKIEATFDPGTTDNQIRVMVQSLLTERFQMRSHQVTAEAEGYELHVGKSGLKIKAAESANDTSVPGPESYVSATLPEPGVGIMRGQRASMSQLAETLQRSMGMPVWDQTGITGQYDFVFRYAQGLSADFQADAPSLASALRDNLGLDLKRQRGPVATLIVDSIQEPTEN